MKNAAIIIRPTFVDVINLAEGSEVPRDQGGMTHVTRIIHRGMDRTGKAFVQFCAHNGDGSEISGSMKEGRIVLTRALTSRFSSAELEAMQRSDRVEHSMYADDYIEKYGNRS